MDFTPVREAALEAFRHKDYARCFQLVDDFLGTASGHARALALQFKSAVIAIAEPQQAEYGLQLIDEAFPYFDSPGEQFFAVIDALAHCIAMEDVESAERYTEIGYDLLRNHADEPVIARDGFKLHMSLGCHADAHGNLVQAYWHFHQATQSVIRTGLINDPNYSCYGFWLHLHTANVCRKMQRYEEANEALDLAGNFVTTQEFSALWRKSHQALSEALGGEIMPTEPLRSVRV